MAITSKHWDKDFDELSISVAGCKVGSFSGRVSFCGSQIQYVVLEPLALGQKSAVLFGHNPGTVNDHVLWNLITDALYERFSEDIDEWCSDTAAAERNGDARFHTAFESAIA